MLVRRAIKLSHTEKNWTGEYWFGDKTKPKLEVLIIGDSVAASLGVRDFKSTIEATVGKYLGKDYYVHLINRAQLGARTTELAQEEIQGPWDITIAFVGNGDLIHGIKTSLSKMALARLAEHLKGRSRINIFVGPGAVETIKIFPFWYRLRLKYRLKDYGIMLEKFTKQHNIYFANPLKYKMKDEYFSADQTHPNASGETLWANVIWEQIATALGKDHAPLKPDAKVRKSSRFDALFSELLFWTHTAIVIFMLFMGLFLSLWWVAGVLILQKIHLYLFDGCAITRWEQAIGGMPQDMTYFQMAFKRFFNRRLSHAGAHTVYLFVTSATILLAVIGTLIR